MSQIKVRDLAGTHFVHPFCLRNFKVFKLQVQKGM